MAQDVFSMAHTLTIFEPIWPKLQNLSKTLTQTHTCIHTDTQTHRHTDIDTQTQAQTHRHTHTCTDTYIHTHTHIIDIQVVVFISFGTFVYFSFFSTNNVHMISMRAHTYSCTRTYKWRKFNIELWDLSTVQVIDICTCKWNHIHYVWSTYYKPDSWFLQYH